MSPLDHDRAAPSAEALPPDTRLGRVCLRVGDLARAVGFYRDVIGLCVLGPGARVASLGADEAGPELVRLEASRSATARPRRSTGLYHLAILFPDRAALAWAIVRLRDARWPVQGFADHRVSEAVYLADPDGNGVELYADRPRERWRDAAGTIRMTTEPLDVDDLLGEIQDGQGSAHARRTAPETRIGHIHLHVSDLARGEKFYAGGLGFEVMVRGYPGALFLAADGYHHHIGINVWAGQGAPRPPPNSVGLQDFEVIVPGEGELERVLRRLDDGGWSATPRSEGWRVEDPDGNGVVLRR